MTVAQKRQAGKLSRTRDSRLFLTIDQTVYAVRSLPCDSLIGPTAFRLRKSDGTLYDVAQTHGGPQCDCPDFIFRRDGLDPSGCKHVKALVAQGMIGSHALNKADSESSAR